MLIHTSVAHTSSVEEGTSEGLQALGKQGMEFGQESEPQLRETAKKSREEIQYLLWKNPHHVFQE